MRTETHEITLRKAKEFLEHNIQYERGKEDTNRPISLRKVNHYAVEMLCGRWRHTHQGIGFDTAGWMKDGQHRLLALVQACTVGASEGGIDYEANPKLKIKMQVTFGLDTDIFDVLDVGLNRSANQILTIAGYKDTTALAGAARLLYMFDSHEYKYWHTVKVSNHDVLRIVREASLDAYLPEVRPIVPLGFMLVPSIVGYFVCERAYPSGPHGEFLEALRSGVNIPKDDARLVFRNLAIKSKSLGRVRRESSVHLAYWIKTWNDYVNGYKRSALNWRVGEAFPKPIEK